METSNTSNTSQYFENRAGPLVGYKNKYGPSIGPLAVDAQRMVPIRTRRTRTPNVSHRFALATITVAAASLACPATAFTGLGALHSANPTRSRLDDAKRRYNPGVRSRNCHFSRRRLRSTARDTDEADAVTPDANLPDANPPGAIVFNETIDEAMSDSPFAAMPIEAVALLNVVAVIWGTQHAVIKMVVDDCDASAFSFARFGLAALIASPYIPSLGPVLGRMRGDVEGGLSDNAGSTIVEWRWGLEMGLWMFLGYAFQSVGLAYTTALRSGFLLYLNVKFVPFFARFLFGREISLSTWASALSAFVGTAMLSYDGASTVINVGDLWSVAAAAASAMFILRLEAASSAVEDSSALNAACLCVVTAASLVWTVGAGCYAQSTVDIVEAISSAFGSVAYTVQAHPLELIYLGGVTTALANYIQTKAQKSISAERASIIYAMDPVYGAVFANLLLGEELNGYGIAGAGLITVAAATNAFLDLGPKDCDESEAVKN